MSDPLALATRFIDEVFNRRNYAVAEELVAPDMLEHQFESPDRPARRVGPAGVVAIAKSLHAGSSDFHLAIEDSAVSGDTVWLRNCGTATDDGGQQGRPATGRRLVVPVIDIMRFENGKMVEHWGVPDRLNQLQQLGHLPAPGGRK